MVPSLATAAASSSLDPNSINAPPRGRPVSACVSRKTSVAAAPGANRAMQSSRVASGGRPSDKCLKRGRVGQGARGAGGAGRAVGAVGSVGGWCVGGGGWRRRRGRRGDGSCVVIVLCVCECVWCAWEGVWRGAALRHQIEMGGKRKARGAWVDRMVGAFAVARLCMLLQSVCCSGRAVAAGGVMAATHTRRRRAGIVASGGTVGCHTLPLTFLLHGFVVRPVGGRQRLEVGHRVWWCVGGEERGKTTPGGVFRGRVKGGGGAFFVFIDVYSTSESAPPGRPLPWLLGEAGWHLAFTPALSLSSLYYLKK